MADYIAQSQLIQKSALQPDDTLVVRFVDFSSKYGLGYKLSNGAYGVLFNDSTKIITSSNLFHFVYLEKIRDILNPS
jgi:polo-like kinase 1